MSKEARIEPEALTGLSKLNRALWDAFDGAQPDWREISVEWVSDRNEDGGGYVGFALLSDGEGRICLYRGLDEDDVPGVADELYVHVGGGEDCIQGEADLETSLKLVAAAVASGIASGYADDYEPDDVHPLIRAEVERLLRTEYTRGLW